MNTLSASGENCVPICCQLPLQVFPFPSFLYCDRWDRVFIWYLLVNHINGVLIMPNVSVAMVNLTYPLPFSMCVGWLLFFLSSELKPDEKQHVWHETHNLWFLSMTKDEDIGPKEPWKNNSWLFGPNFPSVPNTGERGCSGSSDRNSLINSAIRTKTPCNTVTEAMLMQLQVSPSRKCHYSHSSVRSWQSSRRVSVT